MTEAFCSISLSVVSFGIAGLHLTVINQKASPKRKEKGRRRRNQRSKCFQSFDICYGSVYS